MFRLRLSEAKNNLLNPQKYRQVNPFNPLNPLFFYISETFARKCVFLLAWF